MLVAEDMDSLQSSSLNGINKTIPHHIDFYGVPLRAERMLRDYHLDSASRDTFFSIFHFVILWRLSVTDSENSQGKWNETIDSDNGKGWKSDRCLRYSTKTITRILSTHTRDKQHSIHFFKKITTYTMHLLCIKDGLCMHVLFDLTTKTIAEYLRTYVVNFSGIRHTSLTNN
jgi:hypothetical protein